MKSSVVLLEADELEIPAGISDLAAFREWLYSPEFPETGRFDWLQGRVEVEVTPEDLETHGSPKSTIAGELIALVQKPQLGHVYIDRTRLTCPAANLSVEPDILVLMVETVRSGRARLVPRAGAPDRFIEIEGAADLVVECVSDSSVRKDLIRLRELYHRAGIREYWIVDARQQAPRFDVLIHQPGGYVDAPASPDGFHRSEILAAELRFARAAVAKHGGIFFSLDVRQAAGAGA